MKNNSQKTFVKITSKVLLVLMMLTIPFTVLVGCTSTTSKKTTKTSDKYTGYDNYVWNGTTRTEKLDVKATAFDDDVLESTIGVESEPMSKYFSGEYVDLSDSKIALMSYYIEKNGYDIPDDWQTPKQYTAYTIPTSGTTAYSSTVLEKLTIYAEEDGKLEIGTALLSDIYNARVKGSAVNGDMTSFNVTKGKNELDVNLFVNGDSTVIIGGNGSVGLYYAKGINVDDNQGDFQVLDGTKKDSIYSETDEVKDKLALRTQISCYDEPIEDVRRTYIDNLSTYSEAVLSVAPYTYYDSTILAGKKITQIEIPVRSVGAINGSQTFTLRVANKTNAINNGNLTGARTYVINLPLNALQGLNASSINKWISVDVRDKDINVGANEVLLFCASTDTVVCTYLSGSNLCVDELFYTYNGSGSAMNSNVTDSNPQNVTNNNLMFKVYTENTEDIADTIGYIKEDYELIKKLDGKTVSLIGDSISTFNGVNNNSNYNSTIGGNAVCYLGKGGQNRVIDKPGDTWWGRTIDKLGMKLCVNGAWSGSSVADETEKGDDLIYRDAYLAAGCNSRPYHLHRDNGTRVDPDIIFVYMGTNDCIRDGKYGISTGNANNINWNTIESTNWDSYTMKNGFASASWINKNVDYKYYTNVVGLDFATSYAIMMYKIHKTYPNAQIYCLTVLHHGLWNTNGYTETENTIMEHNAAIRGVSEHFGDTVVDIYSLLGGASYNSSINSVGDNLHPNEDGMRLMSDCVIDAIKGNYVE